MLYFDGAWPRVIHMNLAATTHDTVLEAPSRGPVFP
jgi:hypothetical protein